MKNHISFLKHIQFTLKGYNIIPARSYVTKSLEYPFAGYKRDHYILTKDVIKAVPTKAGKKVKVREKSDFIRIVDRDGNDILKEGLNIPIFCNENFFVVYNIGVKQACFYSYDGELIRNVDCLSPVDIRLITTGSCFDNSKKTYISVTHYSKQALGDILDFETPLRLTTLRSEVKTSCDVFDEKGNILLYDVNSLTTYSHLGGVDVISYGKDNKCYVILKDETVIECDMLLHIASYGKLPLLLGFKEKGNKKSAGHDEIFYYFLSMNGKLNRDVAIRSISRSDTTSAYRIEGKDYKYNYISGENGSLLSDTWYYNATCFSYCRVFAKENHSGFYKMLNTKGEVIPLKDNIKITRVKTNFGFVQKPGISDGLAIVDVRVYKESDTDNYIYIDKEVYIDVYGNIYDI